MLNGSAEPKAVAGIPETSDLPFVIAAPQSYEDFSSLVGGRSPADLSTAVRRIRVTNKAALAADGKRSLQV